MLRLYIKFRRYFINHPFWPYFLSHGIVHIIGAILTIILCIHFYDNSLAYEPVYKQVDLKLTDNFSESAKYIEIAFDSSTDLDKDDEYSSTLSVYAAYGPTDTTMMRKIEPFYHDPERITFIGRDDYGKSYFATPNYNPYIEDSSQKYRVSRLSLATLNSEFVCVSGTNPDPSVCHIDTLSSKYIEQNTYCDYRKVSGEKSREKYRSNLCNDLELIGNFLKDSNDNPYYHFSLIINDRLKDHKKAEGIVTFRFGNDDSTDQMIHLNFLQCMPSTYNYNPVDGLTFDIQDVLDNGGIYFLAEDLALKDKAERKIFMSSVLLGACLAFLIDIIVNLVIKWRNLAKRKKRLNKARSKD